MSEHELRHLAIIAGTAPAISDDVAATVVDCCGKAAQIAQEAFILLPGLVAFSWLTPGIDRLLAGADAPTADRARTAGARTLAAAAAGLGATLRLCGRLDGPPGANLDLAARTTAGRTLLWFQQYGGRDEIVRAADRFFRANPGRPLADGELDAWLDTAGVPDPDLLLYAGGALEPRDLLLWQGSYAEIWHTPTSWESFTRADLHRAIADFHARQRRFGR